MNRQHLRYIVVIVFLASFNGLNHSYFASFPSSQQHDGIPHLQIQPRPPSGLPPQLQIGGGVHGERLANDEYGVAIQTNHHQQQLQKHEQGTSSHFSTDVHIVYAASKQYLLALFASLKSILENTRTPEAMVLHFFRLQDELLDGYLSDIQEYVESKGARLKVHDYSLGDVAPFINTHFNIQHRDLKDPSNYVRFILVNMLPFDSCLWIDSDTIVQGDVVPFITNRDHSKGIAAFPRFRADVLGLDDVREKLQSHGVDYLATSSAPSFNTGVTILNLAFWREHDIYSKIVNICNLNRELKLWTKFGSQPPLQLLFSGDSFEHLDFELYADGLGWKWFAEPKDAMFLHWDGDKKPWLETGLHKEYWQRYADPFSALGGVSLAGVSAAQLNNEQLPIATRKEPTFPIPKPNMKIFTYGGPRSATTLLFNMVTVCYFLYLMENCQTQASQLTFGYSYPLKGGGVHGLYEAAPNVLKTHVLDYLGTGGGHDLVFATASDKEEAVAIKANFTKNGFNVAFIQDAETLKEIGTAGLIRVFVEGFGLSSEAADDLQRYFSAWEILRQCCGKQMSTRWRNDLLPSELKKKDVGHHPTCATYNIDTIERIFVHSKLFAVVNSYSNMVTINKPSLVDGELNGTYCSSYNNVLSTSGANFWGNTLGGRVDKKQTPKVDVDNDNIPNHSKAELSKLSESDAEFLARYHDNVKTQ
eukprot:scaffold1813_cov185-Alexandrium_tamarense.AAC.7